MLIYRDAEGQARNQLFISGRGNFHEISFQDVIVLIQPWYNFLANGELRVTYNKKFNDFVQML